MKEPVLVDHAYRLITIFWAWAVRTYWKVLGIFRVLHHQVGHELLRDPFSKGITNERDPFGRSRSLDFRHAAPSLVGQYCSGQGFLIGLYWHHSILHE